MEAATETMQNSEPFKSLQLENSPQYVHLSSHRQEHPEQHTGLVAGDTSSPVNPTAEGCQNHAIIQHNTVCSSYQQNSEQNFTSVQQKSDLYSTSEQKKSCDLDSNKQGTTILQQCCDLPVENQLASFQEHLKKVGDQ
jgi:hypothetical protein